MTEKGFFSVIGVDPSGNGKREFKIPSEVVKDLESEGPEHRLHDLKSAVEVLKNPSCIYADLKRHGQKKGLCYIGKPKQYGRDWEAPAPRDMLFVVYATERFTIFEWGWEKVDPSNKDQLKNITERFGRLSWKRS